MARATNLLRLPSSIPTAVQR